MVPSVTGAQIATEGARVKQVGEEPPLASGREGGDGKAVGAETIP